MAAGEGECVGEGSGGGLADGGGDCERERGVGGRGGAAALSSSGPSNDSVRIAEVVC